MFIASPESWTMKISWCMTITASLAFEPLLKCYSITFTFLLIKLSKVPSRTWTSCTGCSCWFSFPMPFHVGDIAHETVWWRWITGDDELAMFIAIWFRTSMMKFIFHYFFISFWKTIYITFFCSVFPAWVSQHSPPRLMPWYQKDTFAACCQMVGSKRTIGMVC